MNASIRAQCKHESAMKAVRVNGKITKVKQPQDQSNSKMGESGRNIRQTSQILLINLNYGKTQLCSQKKIIVITKIRN